MEIKQLMTLKPVNLFENCLISSNRKTIVNQSSKTDILSKTLEETIETPEENIVVETSSSNTLEESIESPIIQNNTIQIDEPEKEGDDITLEENTELEIGENIVATEKNHLDDLEFNVDLEKLDASDSFSIKPHNDIYYERYREAQKRARIAKNLALQAYLEAKEIKNKYQLDDIDSDDDDFFNTDEQEIEESAR